jgi:ActR/RegA family two-component response regulator
MIPSTKIANSYRPGLVVAHADRGYATVVGRSFERLGWAVFLAGSAAEVRRLARNVQPAAVVLGTELDEESGWLTCTKLTREHPELRVILVGEGSEPADDHFAHFVGAAGLVDRSSGAQAVIAEVCSAALPAVG